MNDRNVPVYFFMKIDSMMEIYRSQMRVFAQSWLGFDRDLVMMTFQFSITWSIGENKNYFRVLYKFLKKKRDMKNITLR